MVDIFEEITRVKREGARVVLATIVEGERESPGKTGFRMLIYPNGQISGTVGGGLLEAKVREEASRCMQSNKAELVEYILDERNAHGLGMRCGGKVKVFLEVIEGPPKLFVFGGGHIALSLVQFAKQLDYWVLVADNREEFGNKQRFPLADETQTGDYANIVRALEFRESDSVVIVTHGHAFDQVVLKECLAKSSLPGYIGMIGSKRKIAATFSDLKAQGVTHDLLARVRSPIGLDIGGKTPAEIALSIMAETVAEKYGKATGLRST
jgi:xanthine dehydrogenase accessory factor